MGTHTVVYRMKDEARSNKLDGSAGVTEPHSSTIIPSGVQDECGTP